MKRRTFLQSLAAMAGMSSGCQMGYVAGKPVRYELFSGDCSLKYDLRYPFQQGRQLFTSDSRILIAEDRDLDVFENCKKLPPVSDLWWDEFETAGWSPLPPQRLETLERIGMCHACYGTGRTGMFSRCGTCHGNSDNWGMLDSGLIGCPDCHFGWVGGDPCTVCKLEFDCDGDVTVGWLPEGSESAERIDGQLFGGGYMSRLRTLPGDIEYRLLRSPVHPHGAMNGVLAFRWGNGGKGFLCGVKE